VATVAQVISQGKLGPGTPSALGSLESRLPEGTQMELVLTTPGITVPAAALAALAGPAGVVVALVGDITGPRLVSASQAATGLAGLVNSLGGSGGPFASIKRWPGQALASSSGSQVRIRWVKEAPAAQILLASLAALTAGGVAAFLGASVPVILVAAAVVGGLFFLAYPAYQLVAWVVKTVLPGLPGGSSVGLDVLLLGAGVLGVYLLAKGRSHGGHG